MKIALPRPRLDVGTLISGLIGLTVVWAVLRGDHLLLIHPRYTGLVVGSALVLLLTALFGLVWRPTRTHAVPWQVVVLGVPFVGLLLLPPQPLSEMAALERAGNLQRVPLDDVVSGGFALPPEQRALQDWVAILQAGDNPEAQLGEPAVIEGMLLPLEEEQPRGFWVVKFRVACCAADARPVGLWVESQTPLSAALRDADSQWVRVRGRIAALEGPDGLTFGLQATEVEPIDTPRNPYF